MKYPSEAVMQRIVALKLPEKDQIAIGLLCQIRDLLMVMVGEHVADDDDEL